jgi:hypothetical protein
VLTGAILALLALALLAPSGLASEGVGAKVEAATRAATRAAERESVRMQREATRAARRAAKRQAREAVRLALKEKEGNAVKIDCTKVTVEYHGFPAIAGSPNDVVEWIAIKNPPESLATGPVVFPPIAFAFEGANGTSVVPIAFPVGHYVIDVHAKWSTNGAHGNFDIHGNVTCGPAPAFTIHKLQTIDGSGQPPTEAPLGGQVGQTVDYEIVLTNTGNTPLTFGALTDPRCDPKTISGGSAAPVEPLGTVIFTCTHTLTAADETAGSYTNVASVTATPEESEGARKTQESNPVVVTPVSAPPKKEEPKEEPKVEPKGETKGEETPNTPTTTTTTTTNPPAGGVLGSTPVTKAPEKSGVLGFASATVPTLRGPQGCVRGAFTASIKSVGVSSVVYYLDGRKIRTLTAASSRKGLLSVRIDATRLHVGVHHVLARITMKKASASAKAAKAARSLTVIRCKSAVVTPHFAG